MTTNGEKLKSVVELSEQLTDISRINSVSMSGMLSLDDSTIKMLVALDDMDLNLVVKKNGQLVSTANIVKLKAGEDVHISFRYPRYPQAFFAESFDDFLPNHEFKYQQPILFYLADQKQLVEKDSEVENVVITAYKAVLELIQLIEINDISDHHLPGRDRFFLFLGHEQKFRLPIKYTAQNLRNGGDSIKRSVERLKHFMEDGVHPSDKRLILKKTFIEMLAPQGEVAGFSFLIENLSELVDRFIGNFELYAGKYTFEDEKQKLLIEIRDYFRAVNDAISSAQVRLVAIPLTLLIVGNKMVTATIEANAPSNTAVLLGVFIFAILMGRLTYSQKATLESEKIEIDSRKKQISERFVILYESLNDQFIRLEQRLSFQKNTLRIINGAIILVCLFTIFTFFYHDTHSVLSSIFLSEIIN